MPQGRTSSWDPDLPKFELEEYLDPLMSIVTAVFEFLAIKNKGKQQKKIKENIPLIVFSLIKSQT